GEGVVQLSSADGVTWSPPDQKVRLLSRQGPALLLGYSGLTLSAEGAAPVSLTLPENFSPVGGVVEGGRTVLVARDALAVSTDGRTWQVTRPAKRACELGSVVAGKGNLFAMCWLGASEMLHSEDGVNWQSLPDFWAYNLMFEGDRFFAVGHDTLLTSGDGKTWETRHQTPQIASVAYGNGRYVAVGAAGLILVSDPVTPSATGPSVAAPDLVGSSLQIDATESVGQPYKVTITLRDAEGRPMAGRPVRLGEAERYSTNQVQVTNANGQARFQFLGFYGDMKTATYLAQDILTGRWLQSRVSLRHTTCGQRFADVSDRHESCREIETAAVRGLMGGYPDGSFRGNQQLTRAELAKVAVLAAGRKPEPGQTLPFHDTTGHWAARDGYLQAAVALGAIQGDPGGRFRPDAPVTRADLVKVMAVIAGLKPAAVKAEDWYVPWVVSAYAMRLIGALVPAPLFPAAESLAAEQPATREETARILTNLYYLQMRQPTQ
ncbi:MAG TPA: S-layer homology domain-containing protein, partial [Symbiobacteriaceae bacterium]|nr:S-layer homology domain-containing protein [Symbiobacteriaceae bacterium]